MVESERDTAKIEHADFYESLTKRKSIKEECTGSLFSACTVINYETFAEKGRASKGLRGKERLAGTSAYKKFRIEGAVTS